MSRSIVSKQVRQSLLTAKLDNDPFLTDEELSETLAVSIPTIRLDRLELGIPQLRERIKSNAEKNLSKIKALQSEEMIGEILDIHLGKYAIAMLQANSQMTFHRADIVRGHYIYSFAESLAIALTDAQVALVGVANIKYKTPVTQGMRLIAKAELKRNRGNKASIWVKIFEKQNEVFRGKFILVTDKSSHNEGGNL